MEPLARFELWTVSTAIKERAMPERQRKNQWSADVSAHSDALDLEPNVCEKKNAGAIAAIRALRTAQEQGEDRCRKTVVSLSQ
jgi:Protein of unknown function (DUF3175)